MMKCRPCKGTGTFPPPYNKCPKCDGKGIIDIDAGLPNCRRCHGTGIFPPPYNLCSVCDGTGKEIPKQNGILVYGVKAGEPYTTPYKLQEILSDMKGHIRICDPYLGERSLQVLSLLKNCQPVHFLTYDVDKNNKLFKEILSNFKEEYVDFEFKLNNSNDIHDRYILSSDFLVLVGHGLKNIGDKGSFVVKLPRDFIGDMIGSIANSFDEKWKNALPI